MLLKMLFICVVLAISTLSIDANSMMGSPSQQVPVFQPAQSQETLNKNYEQKYNQYASEHQYVNTNPTAPQSTSTSQEPTTPKYTINPQYKTAPQNSIKPQYEQSLENYRDSTLDEIRRMIWFKQNENSLSELTNLPKSPIEQPLRAYQIYDEIKKMIEFKQNEKAKLNGKEDPQEQVIPQMVQQVEPEIIQTYSNEELYQKHHQTTIGNQEQGYRKNDKYNTDSTRALSMVAKPNYNNQLNPFKHVDNSQEHLEETVSHNEQPITVPEKQFEPTKTLPENEQPFYNYKNQEKYTPVNEKPMYNYKNQENYEPVKYREQHHPSMEVSNHIPLALEIPNPLPPVAHLRPPLPANHLSLQPSNIFPMAAIHPYQGNYRGPRMDRLNHRYSQNSRHMSLINKMRG